MGAVNASAVTCWKCRAEARALTCPACGVVQPVPAEADLFAVLGLPRRLAIDPQDLERRYHAASRAVHPDLQRSADARERELILVASAAVNRAYRTLRDPIARGRYWLELHGTPAGDETKAVPPAIVAEVFETQEKLAELRTASGEDVVALRREVEGLRDDLALRVGGLRNALVALYDANGTGPPLDDLRRRLAEIAYIRTLLGDVEETIGEGLRATDHRH